MIGSVTVWASPHRRDVIPNATANFTLICSANGKTPAALEFGKLIVSMSKSPARAAEPDGRAR